MKTIFRFLFFISLSYSALAERPNIILVFIDDMGWGDFSCFGNQAAKTPHIDRLARRRTSLRSVLCQLAHLFSLPRGHLHWSVSSTVGKSLPT
jgi:hypothetical protein